MCAHTPVQAVGCSVYARPHDCPGRGCSVSRVCVRDPSSFLAADHGGGHHSRRKTAPIISCLSKWLWGGGGRAVLGGRFGGPIVLGLSLTQWEGESGYLWPAAAVIGGGAPLPGRRGSSAGGIGGGIRPRRRPPERRRRGTTPRIFPRPQGGRHARARTARRGVFSARRAKIGGFEVWVSVVFARILGGRGGPSGKAEETGPEGGGVRKERGTVAAHLIIYICARVYARVGVRTRERGMYEKKSVLCLAVTNFIRTFAA